MKIRGKLLKKDDGVYYMRMYLSPHVDEEEEVPVDEILDEFNDSAVELDITPFELESCLKRGTVRVKPIQFGMPHYQDVHGSVCSTDVEGCPPVEPIRIEQLDFQAGLMAEAIARNNDFVHVDRPLVIFKHQDMRRIAAELTMDTDAVVVGYSGCNPLEDYYIKSFKIPVFNNRIPDNMLLGLRGKKYLQQSKFIYIGEIPSFSAPNGPWDFFKIQDRFGIRFRHVETNEFFRYFDRITDAEAQAELKHWSEDFRSVEPSGSEMLSMTRVYLTLKKLAEREDANGITINCGRFTEERPVVPCLPFARLIDEGIMCACEGDITAMLSSIMLHGISNKPVMMGNFGAKPGQFEAKAGEVTIEHDVLPLSMGQEKFNVRDYHGRKFGVTAFTPVKTEPVTLLNLSSSLDKISVIEGWVKGSFDGIHCRIIVRISVKGDVNRVPDVVVGSQHISMCFGHWLEPIREMARYLGLEILTLE
ncbi:MAG: hypothetical protein ACTSWN_05010 [Promethearchaeota archaeon]